VLTGDQYLRRRPMKRVVTPLATMGARIWGGAAANWRRWRSTARDLPRSATFAACQRPGQSAILLAGLYAEGDTTVREPHLSRDHSERMLTWFRRRRPAVPRGVTIAGRPRLVARDMLIPGDVSSATFFLVAGLINPGAELLIKNVGLNPSRSGAIEILRAMGGELELLDEREQSGEPVADIVVRHSRLKGIEIGGEVVPRAIDEFPVLSVAAALAEGTTTIRDAEELRVKETDRIAAMASELGKLGAAVEPTADGMVIHGRERLEGGVVTSTATTALP